MAGGDSEYRDQRFFPGKNSSEIFPNLFLRGKTPGKHCPTLFPAENVLADTAQGFFPQKICWHKVLNLFFRGKSVRQKIPTVFPAKKVSANFFHDFFRRKKRWEMNRSRSWQP
jgi:hypothetical protein